MAEQCNYCRNCRSSYKKSELTETPCNHMLCSNCFKLSSKNTTLECPICFKSFTLPPFQSIQNSNLKPEPPNLLPNLSQHDSLLSKIQCEIQILQQMLIKIKIAQTDSVNHITQSTSTITETFSHLAQNLEVIQTSILSKIEEINTANQLILGNYIQNLNSHIEKRQKILEKVSQIPQQSLDFNTQIEINSLSVISPLEIQLYKFESCIDSVSLSNYLGTAIIGSVKIEFNKLTIEQALQPKPNNALNNNPKEPLISFLAERNPEKKPEDVQGLVNNCYEPRDEFEYPQIPCDQPFWPKKSKSKRNPTNPHCEWFIELTEDLRQLPNFVCDQISQSKDSKSIITIYKNGQAVNLVDLSQQLYHSLDPFGKIIPEKSHKLIYIPN